ncbi:recombinase family protein [Isoptericola sp. NPDC056134]|uniref:recombinase family protein n=1 Tax=Isoptericola sp. NPDC056134 TaxID=3345723 RepID=UPI0035EEB5D0
MKMQASDRTLRALIYTRISSDRDGREEGVERQEQDCRRLAERLGYEVVDVLVENDTSASTASKKPRPQYDQMVRDVRAGRADVILAYSLSRLTRRVREFLDLIDLHRATGVLIKTCVSGDPDLSTADGRGQAINIANWDQMEAERTAERVRRSKEAAALSGEFRGGPRPFGYESDGMTVRESEARLVREATQAVLTGRSVRALVREWNVAGIATAYGNEWTVGSMRQVLARARNAGIVAVGRPWHDDYKEIGPAKWPAIIEEDTWRAVLGVLLDSTRRTNHSNGDRRWLGSGLYVCGRCDDGSAMRVSATGATPSRSNQKRRYHYRCETRAHLTIDQPKTDAYIRDVVAELLRDPRIIAAMTPDVNDAEVAAAREQRAVLVARLEQTERDYDEDLIDARTRKRKVDKTMADLAEVDAHLADAAQRSVSSPITAAADPGQEFLDAPLDVQRAVLRAVLRVEVGTAPYRGAAWTSERILLTPVSADPR